MTNKEVAFVLPRHCPSVSLSTPDLAFWSHKCVIFGIGQVWIIWLLLDMVMLFLEPISGVHTWGQSGIIGVHSVVSEGVQWGLTCCHFYSYVGAVATVVEQCCHGCSFNWDLMQPDGLLSKGPKHVECNLPLIYVLGTHSRLGHVVQHGIHWKVSFQGIDTYSVLSWLVWCPVQECWLECRM